MIRITRMKTYRDLEPGEVRQAVEAAQEAAEAVTKVRGAKSCKGCLSSGNLVFIGEAENYRVADDIMADPGVQAAFGRLGAEYGYRPAGDEFLNEIEQVLPFLRQ